MEDYDLLITDRRYEDVRAFWRERLSGVNGGHRFVGNAADDETGSYQTETVRLAPASIETLHRIGGDELGEFTVAAAAIALLLQRYFQRTPTVFRTPPLRDATNREAATDIPLIIDVKQGVSVRDFLGAAARVVEGSYSAPDFPLNEFLRREGAPGESGRLSNIALADERVHVALFQRDTDDLRFKLMLDHDKIEIEYNPRRVEPFLVASFAGCLAGFVAHFESLEMRIDEAPLLTPEERHQLVSAFNRTDVAAPRPATVVSMFEEQVARVPEATALTYEGASTNYRELNEKVNRLAYHLRQQCGINHESLVGIMLERSDLMIIAVLGALKAGAGFVPVDPEYPAHRMQFILGDTNARLLLTQSEFLLKVADFPGQVFALDVESAGLPDETKNPEERAEASNLAYVIYTSGSTGAPKGCQIEHRSLANYVAWAVNYYFDDGACWNLGLYSSLSFDFTITNIFCALLRGQTLHIYPQCQDIQAILTHALHPESGIDALKLTPSHVRLLAYFDVSETRVRKIIVGGEELTGKQVRLLRDINPAIEVYNEYGPTEATVGCIVKKIEDDRAPILIGRPIANTRVYVLDDAGRPVPVGVRGEICVAGAGLARGYHNRQETTAKKFMPNPFGVGERLYRTGDIGRWLPSGELQCFGRRDGQVKVRGYRVEVGEIEAVLAAHEQVSEAVVLLREDHPEDKRLVAYVTGVRDLSTAELRRYATERLPDYMVPAVFIMLAELPLTANGKVDSKALPPPGENLSDAYVAPRTDVEHELVRIWQEIFSVERIGVASRFFELGGDSLVAVQVLSRLWNSFPVTISIDEVFEAQTISELAKRIESAIADGASSAPPDDVAIRPVPRTSDPPLSFAQQRLWFLARLEGPNPAYNIASSLHLEGALDLAALKAAFSEVVRRHEALRTTFPDEGGKPVQRIAPFDMFSLPLIDLCGLPETERTAEATRRAGDEAARPFDLATDGLLRATLLRLGDTSHILSVTMHHIISDAWSMSILIRELGTCYEAFAQGAHPSLPELPVQYADFAVWQRERLKTEGVRRQLTYWKETLANAPRVLELPTDHPRPPVQTYRGGAVEFRLNTALTDKLKSLSQSASASLFMTLLAGYAALLSRYVGLTDVVIGSPVANRTTPEVEPLIGFFVNTLALRIDLGGQPSFRELLEGVRKTALDGFAHQDVPFEQLVDALEIERVLSHSPVFQVMFVYQNTPRASLEVSGLKLSPLDAAEAATAKFDLTLFIEESGTELRATFEFNSDLFDAETIDRLASHLTTLLAAAALDPATAVASLPLLTPSEQSLLLETCAGELANYPNTCLHKLVEEQVERTPGATALVFEDVELTYRELNRRANRLAHRLKRCGAGPDVLVGVLSERSPEMVLGLLAILKAGAAYVPLDPEQPVERLRFMLDNARPGVLLSQEHLVARLPQSDVPIITMGVGSAGFEDEDGDNPNGGARPGNLAYMIYTSGSTGQPKGALNEHRAICNRLLWMRDAYGINPQDCILQKTPYSFDVSVWEFFLPLITGARLVVARPGGHGESDYLARLIDQHKVTTVHFVPTMLRAFLEEPAARGCTSLRRIICSGEALPVDVQELFFERHATHDCVLHNLYGPTEAAVDVTFWQCEQGASRTIPIGRPIANTQIYILDANLRPVPIGVAGELFIGGVPVGRGYHAEPSLTVQKFIPDCFNETPGGRLYRSGDLARFRPDGAIEFIGRADNQIKIRGFRVEPGEIESILGTHPSVCDCLVVIREDRGLRRLAAYVVFAGEPSVAELTGFLKTKLPEYMVPTLFVPVAVLPRLSNGKVNRKALPARVAGDAEPVPGLMMPRNTRETLLAGIWREVLRLESVGVHDNFFGLGGDSILSIQVVARANEAGLRITPRQFFQNQTVAELALVASEKTVVRDERVGELIAPLSPVQLWLIEQYGGVPAHYNQSVLVEVPGNIQPRALAEAARYVYAQHPALSLHFSLSGDEWTQEFAPVAGAEIFAFEDLSPFLPPERETRMRAIAAGLERDMDPARGRLVHMRLFRFGESEPARLFVVVHHLVVDGVSWRILLEDFYAAYERLAHGLQPVLAPEVVSFTEWATQLRLFARQEEVLTAAAYWLEQDAREVRPLPGIRESNLWGDARAVSVALSAAATRQLLQVVPQAYNTRINEVLLAALALSFRQWTDAEFLLVDLEGHGREEFVEGMDTSRTVGWFTSIFPVLLNVPRGVVSPGDILKSVKEQVRVPGQGFYYGILKYLSTAAEIRSKLDSMPPADVLFNYLGQTDAMLPRESGWRAATENLDPSHDPQLRRSHLLEINAVVTDGQLRVDVIYGDKVQEREIIEQLAARLLENLHELIEHCCLPSSRGLTPSDMPYSRLDQSNLDGLLCRIVAGDPAAARDAIEDIYGLSPMQHGMLFHTLFKTGSTTYFEQLCCRIDGALDEAAFRAAWQKSVTRHPVLRTAFHWQELSHPVQVVFGNAELPWETLDWRRVPAKEREARFEKFLEQDRARGFDLNRAPLSRFTLIQVSETGYRFCWSHHHMLLDGWSVAIILREVCDDYEAAARGEKHRAPRTPPAYRNFIAWLQKQDSARAENYWRRELKGFAGPLSLPFDHTPDPATKEQFAKQGLYLSEDLTATLKAQVQRRRLTLNTLMRGAWALLLSRYCNSHDVVCGVTVSGRPALLEDIESMVGLFINTLPARMYVDEDQAFAGWLAGIQSQQAEMEQYSHSSLVDVHGWSEVRGGTPLFDSIFVFENYPVEQSLAEPHSALALGEVQAFEQTNYALSLAVVPDSPTLLRATYDTRRFEPESIRQILNHLQTILEAFAVDPERLISSVPTLSPDEHQLLETWNQTSADYSDDACIHTLFEEQAELAPAATALICGEQQVSFGQLNERANQLSNYLRARGIGAEVPVALCFERSPEMIVALFAVLKAGGAYVPLDPAYPAPRLAHMVRDSGARLLLTHSRVAPSAAFDSIETVCLDSARADFESYPKSKPPGTTSAGNAAYIIYTSGTTGRPKGIVVQHRSVLNLLAGLNRTVYAGNAAPGLRVGLNGPLSFDTSVKQIIQLLNGHTLIVIPEEVRLDAPALLALARRTRLDVLDCTPSQLEMLMAGGLLDGEPTAARLFLIGGESISSVRWKTLASSSRVAFFNLYGPTEATVDATIARVSTAAAAPHIGRPISNTRVYVLDNAHRRVPPGVAGELFIGGAGLARGYRNNPALTASRFIPDSFGAEPGARLYRTGDFGRFRHDGQLEFLGRVDAQLKIRGYRVEPVEIEDALRRHPGISYAAVVLRNGDESGGRLVAYLVAARGGLPGFDELRRHLSQELPAHMIPNSFVAIEQLPLNRHGKIDRAALPAAGHESEALGARHVEPRNEVEERLAGLWRQTLSRRHISVTDNFFDIGGHSLLALSLMTKVEQEFGARLSIAQLFRHPTIEQLAAALRERSFALSWETLVTMRDGGSGGGGDDGGGGAPSLFLIPGAGGNVVCYQPLAQLLDNTHQVFGLQAVGLDGHRPPLESIAEIAAHNVAAIRQVNVAGPFYLVGHSFGGKVALEMSQQLRRLGLDVALLAILDTPAPVFARSSFREDWDDARWLAAIIEEIETFLDVRLGITYDELARLDAESQITFIVERVATSRGEFDGINRDHLRGYLRVYQTSFRLDYQPTEQTHPVPIVLFKAGESHPEDTSPTGQLAELLREPAWGWDRFSDGRMEVVNVTGNHLSMLLEPHVSAIAERLNHYLNLNTL